MCASPRFAQALPALRLVTLTLTLTLTPTRLFPHSAAGSVLGLLLAFRTSQSYERFWEARTLWDGMLKGSPPLTALKVPPWQRPSSAPAPLQGVPGGSGRPATASAARASLAASLSLSLSLSLKSPISLPSAVQVGRRLLVDALHHAPRMRHAAGPQQVCYLVITPGASPWATLPGTRPGGSPSYHPWRLTLCHGTRAGDPSKSWDPSRRCLVT